MTLLNTFLFIILGVIIVVLGYIVYVQYFTQTTSISQTLWLKNKNPPITTIANPQSSIFSYSFWMYINTWPSTSPTNIFNCASSSKGVLFSVDLPDTTPTLTCDLLTGKTDPCVPANHNVVTMTNNLGVQRWVYVIVSVNANIIDCYIDGKLTISFQTNGVPNPSISCTDTDNNWGISFGVGPDIYISGFTRIPYATDPATAMANYAIKPSGAKVSTAYSAYLQINQNNQLLTNLKLF
jgi:hypothetical protein